MKLSRDRISEQKSENILVVVTMIVIVIFTFTLFGWSSMESWLTTPLIWKGQDSLTIYYIGTLPDNKSNEAYNIFLEIANNTNKDIETYRIYADHGAVLLWSDPKTGEYSYKLQCENCRYVEDYIREESKKGIDDGYSCMECGYSNSLIIVCERNQ